MNAFMTFFKFSLIIVYFYLNIEVPQWNLFKMLSTICYLPSVKSLFAKNSKVALIIDTLIYIYLIVVMILKALAH